MNQDEPIWTNMNLNEPELTKMNRDKPRWTDMNRNEPRRTKMNSRVKVVSPIRRSKYDDPVILFEPEQFKHISESRDK